MAIAAGTLTERITLQKTAITRNSIGEEIAGWTDIITGLPAAVRWLKGSRALTFGDVWNPASVSITCRYSEAFEEAERILWHGKVFTVLSAFGDRVNMSMTITAELYNEGKNPEDEPEPTPTPTPEPEEPVDPEEPEEPVEPTSEEDSDGTTDNHTGDGGDSEGD